MDRYVYDFDDAEAAGRELLGGKGAGLAEMTQIGVPVPAGFTITTDACRAYMREGKRMPAGLEEEIDEHVARLEERAGKRLGDPADPLLLSVRSGAAVSMPGMMDTILNLGLSDVATEGLARKTGNERFAYDSYRRLIQMYGEVVDGIDAHDFEQRLTDLKEAKGVQQDTDLDADDLAGARRHVQVDLRAGDGKPVPAGPARAADARSARRLRVLGQPARAGLPARARHPGRPRHRRERDADGLRQQGRRRRRPASASRATRRPGEQGLYGEFLPNAQGEDVVAGIRTPLPLEQLRETLPEAFDQLVETIGVARAALPRHAGHRVHRRGREALPPPDAQREAHRGGGAEGGRRRWSTRG